MINPINIGDTITTKDGMTLEILSIRYKDGSDIHKLEGIDRNSPSPMRISVLQSNFLRVIKKAKKSYDPQLRKWATLQSDNSYKYDEPIPLGGK